MCFLPLLSCLTSLWFFKFLLQWLSPGRGCLLSYVLLIPDLFPINSYYKITVCQDFVPPRSVLSYPDTMLNSVIFPVIFLTSQMVFQYPVSAPFSCLTPRCLPYSVLALFLPAKILLSAYVLFCHTARTTSMEVPCCSSKTILPPMQFLTHKLPLAFALKYNIRKS